MTYSDICTIHNRHHCTDCGYIWFTVDDKGMATHVEGTGAEV